MLLDDKHITDLVSIMRTLSITQKSVATGIGISRSHYNLALNLDKPEKGMGTDKWQLAFDFIESRIDRHISTLERYTVGENVELEPIERRVSLREMIALQQRFENLRQAVFKKGNDVLRVTPPGAIVPGNAVNFIPMSGESDLKDAVQNCHHFVALLSGPIKNGRSSLLTRLVQTAQDAHHRVYRIHFANQWRVSGDSELVLSSLYRIFFEGLTFKFDPDRSSGQWHTDFINEAKENWTDGQTVTVFVEGLEELATSQDKKRVLLRFFHWLNSLRDLDHEKPFDSFQIVALYAPFTEDAFKESPFHSQSERLHLSPFSREQVETLNTVYQLPVMVAQKAFELFLGQPYLTHQFIHTVHRVYTLEKSSIEKIVERESISAINLAVDGCYRRYWLEVCRFLAATQDDVSRLLSEVTSEPEIIEHHTHRVLRLAGVTSNTSDGEFAISPFVVAAIERGDIWS